MVHCTTLQSQGRANPSFVRHALEASDGSPDEEDLILSAAGSLMNGESFIQVKFGGTDDIPSWDGKRKLS